MVRKILLTYDDKKFQKLKHLKEFQEKTSEERKSWERFVWENVIEK